MSTSNASLALEANLSSYMTGDVLGRYGWGAATASDSASFKDTMIAELRATGALAPATEEETSSADTATSTTSTTEATSTTSETNDTSSTTSYTASSNYYDFTTTEWQNAHLGYTEVFANLPGLPSFLGDNPAYGSMFVNDGKAGAQYAISAYLASLSSSSSSVSTTA